MAKTLTKTYRYPSSYVNLIGDIVDGAGNTIDVTNVRLSKVRQEIGEPSYSLYNICNCENINIHSAFRPTIIPQTGNQAYGWETNGLIGIEPVFPTSINGFRLGDFAAYNHDPIVSKLVHDPTNNIWGLPLTTYNKDNFPTSINLRFEIGEISPEDLFIETSALTTPSLYVYNPDVGVDFDTHDWYKPDGTIWDETTNPGDIHIRLTSHDINYYLNFVNISIPSGAPDFPIGSVDGITGYYIIDGFNRRRIHTVWGDEGWVPNSGSVLEPNYAWDYPTGEIYKDVDIQLTCLYNYNFIKAEATSGNLWVSGNNLTAKLNSQTIPPIGLEGDYNISLDITIDFNPTPSVNTYWYIYRHYSDDVTETTEENPVLIDNWEESVLDGTKFTESGGLWTATLDTFTINTLISPNLLGNNLYIHVFYTNSSTPPL